MEALLIGDSHGNQAHMKAMLHIAHEHKYDLAIHLGDFGWWPSSEVNQFIKLCDERAKELGMPLWVIDGNHDFPGEDENDQRGYQHWRFTQDSLYQPGLKWIPRGTLIDMVGSRVLFMGGAASVDKPLRAIFVDWWHEELFTDQDVAKATSHGPVDILLSHDRRTIPPNFRQMWFGDEVQHMLNHQELKWNEILSVATPKLHVHGHFHCKYESVDEEWLGCRTIGLAHENMHSFCGLDFNTLEITWPELADQLKTL